VASRNAASATTTGEDPHTYSSKIHFSEVKAGFYELHYLTDKEGNFICLTS